MGRTIMTIEKSNIDLVIDGNEFNFNIEKTNETIHISGKIESMSQIIFTGLQSMSQSTTETKTPTQQQPKEQLQMVTQDATKKKSSRYDDINIESKIDFDSILDMNMGPRARSRYIVSRYADAIVREVAKGYPSNVVGAMFHVSGSMISAFKKENKDKIERYKKKLDAKEVLDDPQEVLIKDTKPTLPDPPKVEPKKEVKKPEPVKEKEVVETKPEPPKVAAPKRKVEPKINTPSDIGQTLSNVVEHFTGVPTPPPVSTIVVDEATLKRMESIEVDPDDEAKIIEDLIADIAIVKLAKDYKLPKERILKIYHDNSLFINRARESAARVPRMKSPSNDPASKDSLASLASQFSKRY